MYQTRRYSDVIQILQLANYERLVLKSEQLAEEARRTALEERRTQLRLWEGRLVRRELEAKRKLESAVQILEDTKMSTGGGIMGAGAATATTGAAAVPTATVSGERAHFRPAAAAPVVTTSAVAAAGPMHRQKHVTNSLLQGSARKA